MKKIFASILVLMLALTGLAVAEPIAAPAANGAAFTLVHFVEEATATTPASESYALLGAGNGDDAFALYGLNNADYAASYAALWQNVTASLQSTITIDGAFESLIFTVAQDAAAGVEKTIVVMNGENVLEVEGLAAFVMLPQSLGAIVPQIDEACEAYIWTPEGLYEAVELCPNCGNAMIGSSHTTEISAFCKEDHTLCMGDPIHVCNGCGRSYECSHSNSHTKCIKCGELWCYKAEGDHKEEDCGHRGCEIFGEEEKHEKCVGCGKYLCNGKEHKLAACGMHHANAAGDHTAAACGNEKHFNCDGLDHTVAVCGEGHTNCDGQDHSQAACGHYACAEGSHEMLACGHYACAEGSHEMLACGHYACAEGSHEEQACGHYACAGEHSTLSCGHYSCAGGDYEHKICSCGAYDCNGKDHSACE